MKRRRKINPLGIVSFILLLSLSIGGYYGRNNSNPNGAVYDLLSPVTNYVVQATNKDNGEEPERETTVSQTVEKYVERYIAEGERSHYYALMHCLLYRESKHGIDKGMGDNGAAGGPLQFHEGTYIVYRHEMMGQGLIDHLGSRFDTDDAVETTIWAIKSGKGKAWGPILRRECK